MQEALISSLLNKSLEDQFKHVRGLKVCPAKPQFVVSCMFPFEDGSRQDVSEANLVANPDFSDAPKVAMPIHVLTKAWLPQCHLL